MRGSGHADVLIILLVPANKADAVACECLRFLRDTGANVDITLGKGDLDVALSK
jgi:hypothetical protein